MLSVYMSMVEIDDQRDLVEQLYRSCEHMMYNAAFSILHDKQDAEDAVHDAFIRIITNIKKVEAIDRSKLNSFAVIVARNIAIDRYRRLQKQEPIDTDVSDGDVIGGISIVERAVFEKFDQSALHSAIGDLPDTLRGVLVMRYFHDMSTEDIAAMLGIGTKAVQKRIERAVNKLYESMKGDKL